MKYTAHIRPSIPTMPAQGRAEAPASSMSSRRAGALLAVSGALLASAACQAPAVQAEDVPVAGVEYVFDANTPVRVIENEPAEPAECSGGRGGGATVVERAGNVAVPQVLVTTRPPRLSRPTASTSTQSASATPRPKGSLKTRPAGCEGPEVEVKHCYQPNLKLSGAVEPEKGCAIIDIPLGNFKDSAGEGNPTQGLIYMLGKRTTGWVEKVA